jgi:hypothetical protein
MFAPSQVSPWLQRFSGALAALSIGVGGCGVPSLANRNASPHQRAARPAPADLFMRSVEVSDGALGWRQLCPDLQSQVPETAVRSAANAQKAAEAGRVRYLRSDLVGMRKLKSGEQLRLYLLTAELVGGAQASRVYVLHTRAGGCVHDVQTQDVQ